MRAFMLPDFVEEPVLEWSNRQWNQWLGTR